MTIDDAARGLAEAYRLAPVRKKVVAIYLYGIEHAGAIDGMPLGALAERAGSNRAYGTELRKAVNLSFFVRAVER